MWDGTAWVPNDSFLSPTPPADSVNLLEFPTAVNGHPYQTEGQGFPKFSRNTIRGENKGWQACYMDWC